MDQPQPKSPIDHLVGMPPMLMMMMEERLKVRIRQTLGLPVDNDTSVAVVIVDAGVVTHVFPEGVDGLAKQVLRRMMYKRMEAGKQFDSIIESSRKYFAEAMMAEALDPSCNHEWMEVRTISGKLRGLKCSKCRSTKSQ